MLDPLLTNGYVYLWYDTKSKFFYIGSHLGVVSDRYICSSKTMLKAYKLRPKTFKFKVLEYVNGTIKDLRAAEQRWLDMIKDSELMLSENVKNKTCRYYNVKKNAFGGSPKGMKKTDEWKQKIGISNTGKRHSKEVRLQMSISHKGRKAWNKGKTGFISPFLGTRASEDRKNNMRASWTLRRLEKGMWAVNV